MSLLQDLQKESVLIKPNGTCHKIKAEVQSNLIFIDDTSTPIEIGDILEQTRSNGICDIYEITDVTIYDSPRSNLNYIEATFRNVRRPVNNSKYHIGSINADRVYFDSSDNSTNIVVCSCHRFDELKKALSNEPNAKVLHELIEQIRTSENKERRSAKILEFLDAAANCMTIVQPFIGWLTQL